MVRRPERSRWPGGCPRAAGGAAFPRSPRPSPGGRAASRSGRRPPSGQGFPLRSSPPSSARPERDRRHGDHRDRRGRPPQPRHRRRRRLRRRDGHLRQAGRPPGQRLWGGRPRRQAGRPLRHRRTVLRLLQRPGPPVRLQGRPGRRVIDLSGTHIRDASSVAAPDAIETKYAQRGKKITIIGLNEPGADMHQRPAGRLTDSHRLPARRPARRTAPGQALHGQRHRLGAPPDRRRSAASADDPQQPPALVVVGLSDPHTFSHVIIPAVRHRPS